LWPKVCLLDDLPETYAKSLPRLGQSGAERLQKVTTLSLEPANGRIEHNHALNETKAWALNGSFGSMSIGLLVELGAIDAI
jgi:hypothetical protein